MLDYLIVGGAIPNYETGELEEANVGIEGNKVTFVGPAEPAAKEVINGEDCVVSPGFIDIHMHEEDYSEGSDYVISEWMLRMGVTTGIAGNCGLQFQSMEEFSSRIKSKGGSPINYQLLAGYNNCRYQLGIDTYEEAGMADRDKMKEMLRKELDAGCAGISFGIEYDPGMTTDEILYAAALADDPELLVSAHYRAESDSENTSVKEMIEIQKAIAGKFQISHLSSCSAMGQMADTLKLIHEHMDIDPRLSYDTYPYAAFCTHIGSTVFEGDDPMSEWGKTWNDLLLTEPPYENVRCTKELFEKVRAEYPKMLVVAFAMNEDEIEMAVADRYGMIASDGIIAGGKGHPRAAGTFPRVFRKYVRERGALSLVEAIRKCSYVPALRMGLEDKGFVAEGADADLVIFSPDEIADKSTFSEPGLPPEGIRYVFVGGTKALEDNVILSRQGGRVLGKSGVVL